MGMARHGHLPAILVDTRAASGGTMGLSMALLLTGFILPTVALAVAFGRSPAPAWMGMEGAWDIALASWKAVYGGVVGAVPQVGWILIAVVSAVPAVLYAWARARPLHAGSAHLGWTCLFLAFLAAALVLNVPFAPWPLFGGQSPSPFPYVWIAVWGGLVVSTLLRLLAQRARRRTESAGLPRSVHVAAGLAAAVALASGFLNFSHADGRSARPFGWLARGVAGEAAGAEWIVSHGVWDDIVQIAANGRQPPLRTLRWNLARQDVYLAWLSHRLAGSPRLAGLAPAGLEAVVPVWLASISTPPRSVVALDLPEVFTVAGARPVPGAWVYHRGTNGAPPGVHRGGRDLDRWRTTAVAMRARVERAEFPLREYGSLALRHAGRIMNDRGVFLEDSGHPEDAIRAYTAALDANPSNLVARINLSRVVRSLGRLETARIDASLVRYLDEMPGPVDIVSRTSVDGILRDPAALAASGLRRSASGDTHLAVADLLAALSLGGSNDVAAAAAARALASQGRMAEARAVLDEAELQTPGSDALGIARSHVALASRDPAAAERALAAADPSDPRRRLTTALVHMARNEWQDADAILQNLQAQSPSNTEAIALSAVVGLRLGLPARVRSAETSLREAGQKHPLVSVSLAVLLLEEKRRDEARQVLEAALVRHPDFRPARSMLIRIEHEAGRLESMREHVFALLRQTPRDPAANLQLAEWQVEAGHPDLAEATLWAVLEQHRVPAVLNNLAWVIRQQGRAAEALALAEEAVRLAPGFASARDTLAVVLSDLGRTAEALEAAAEAERLAPENRTIRDRAAGLRAGRPVPRSR